MGSKPSRRTPLYDRHVDLGAKLVPFSGYEMPVQYAGIGAEHQCVRSAVGLCDVSHMGEFRISGADALAFLQEVTINDVAALEEGQAQYSAMCYSDGGIVDDLVLYRRADHYLMVVNAANIAGDCDWLRSNTGGEVTLEDISEELGLIAVQGPASRELVRRVFDFEISKLQFYYALEGRAYSRPVLASRTGYTGELGYELYTDPQTTVRLWDDLLAAGEDLGVQPVGLGARDTLRLEQAYCLYGSDITAETNPIEAGLGWITKFKKGSFIGSQALAKVKAAGPDRKLAAFRMEGRAIPRHGYALLAGGERVGEATSGTQSPTLKQGIGLGYVGAAHAQVGSALEVEIRGKGVRATVVKPPFVTGTSLMA